MSFRVHLNPTGLRKHRNNWAHWIAGEQTLRPTRRNHVPGPRVAILDLSSFQLVKRDLSEGHELLLDSLALSPQAKWWFMRRLRTRGVSSREKQWALKWLPAHFVSSILFVGWFHLGTHETPFTEAKSAERKYRPHWTLSERSLRKLGLFPAMSAQCQACWHHSRRQASSSRFHPTDQGHGLNAELGPNHPELGRETDPSC